MKRDQLLTLNEAAKLIATRDKRPGDDKRAGIDRTRKRISNASKRGELRRHGEKFLLGDVAGWADAAIPTARLEGIPKTIYGGGTIHLSLVCLPSGNAEPTNMEAAKTRIRQLEDENAELRKQCAAPRKV